MRLRIISTQSPNHGGLPHRFLPIYSRTVPHYAPLVRFEVLDE